MNDTTLVTGGTGVLGTALVARLRAAGRPVRVLSRRPPAPDAVPLEGTEWAVGDLTSGAGLAAALEGVGTVVHCATDSRRWKNDPVAAERLVEAARAAGSPHLVYISIVGIDRVPFPYYRAKLAVERIVAGSGLPWTVLRTTQFHDLLLAVARQLTRLPVALVPSGVRMQPVDVADVAARLADLAAGAPAGCVPDMGGPEVMTLADAVRAVLRATGGRRPVLEVPLPGGLVRATRHGGLLAPDNPADGHRFTDFLAEASFDSRRYGAASRGGGQS
ncbi:MULTISPECIES: SDR family oxidoreductase [Streptomycetaceae]|uniref:NAD(P)-binding domain-containing protein n=1 Tax=Streptantibioticus cattleyicolor (strain ATCC 35852 / DSM 46488 / JCM 4925 / NBRC 14057 / NRRL 8057) TaxID=1003195 RepID=F8JVN7_STREN|nr:MULTISPECIES: NAD(P)H-binding protein [Streptomycetaceae]AEW96947.1 hypothetical protein SCATT_45760 [Streptantibioticus cattleyicolor NRRL 8057 = DSM 46488]MYS61419.1 NAD(P)H-binding protein [Streptomyces sp. SID5468]CCB77274.1 conserved protein of unknown function [Streptantibioticus cattleyicolor NRRL 8057 = DSM 46488]